MSEARMQAVATAAAGEQLVCARHCLELTEWFCTVCQVPLCNGCIQDERRNCYNHNYERIADICEREAREMDQLGQNAYSRINDWKQVKTKIDSAVAELLHKSDAAQREIDMMAQQFSERIEAQRVHLSKTLQYSFSNKKNVLTNLMMQIDKNVPNMERNAAMISKLSNYCSPAQILQYKRQVMSQLNHLMSHDVNSSMSNLDSELSFQYNLETMAASVVSGFGFISITSNRFMPRPPQHMQYANASDASSRNSPFVAGQFEDNTMANLTEACRNLGVDDFDLNGLGSSSYTAPAAASGGANPFGLDRIYAQWSNGTPNGGYTGNVGYQYPRAAAYGNMARGQSARGDRNSSWSSAPGYRGMNGGGRQNGYSGRESQMYGSPGNSWQLQQAARPGRASVAATDYSVFPTTGVWSNSDWSASSNNRWSNAGDGRWGGVSCDGSCGGACNGGCAMNRVA